MTCPRPPTANGPERVHGAGFHAGGQGQEINDFAAYDPVGNRGVIGAAVARRTWHEAPPAALGHPGVNAAPEIHAEGLGIGGPAGDRLRLLMRERRPADVLEFVAAMGRTLLRGGGTDRWRTLDRRPRDRGQGHARGRADLAPARYVSAGCGMGQ